MTGCRFSARAAGKLRFEVEHAGGKSTRLLPAADVIWIGREPGCQLLLDAPEVAPRHLSISTQGGKLFVRDHSADGEHAGAPPAIRRLSPPVVLEVGRYRVGVALVPGWAALGAALVAPRRANSAPERFGAWRRTPRTAVLLVASALGLLGLARALLHASPQPSVAAAACAVDRSSIGAAAPATGQSASVSRAVSLLRAGRKLEALAQYRALSARDDSPAALAVVTGLLEYELACPR